MLHQAPRLKRNAASSGSRMQFGVWAKDRMKGVDQASTLIPSSSHFRERVWKPRSPPPLFFVLRWRAAVFRAGIHRVEQQGTNQGVNTHWLRDGVSIHNSFPRVRDLRDKLPMMVLCRERVVRCITIWEN